MTNEKGESAPGDETSHAVAVELLMEELAKVLQSQSEVKLEADEYRKEIADVTAQVMSEAKPTFDKVARLEAKERELRQLILGIIVRELLERKAPPLRIHAGYEFTIRETRKANVADALSLMRVCVEMPKQPFTPSWNNSQLIALIEAGAIDTKLASIKYEPVLVVTKIKENVLPPDAKVVLDGNKKAE